MQICWNVPDGRTFMLWAFAAGWGIPIVGGILVFVLNGVSFRFGSTCYTNHIYSMEVFWIPLLVFIGLAVIIAFATLGYCIKVYVAVLNDPSPSGASVSTIATRVGPRQLYRRTRRVIALQWRGIAVVSIILATVIFYAVVFAFQDNVVRSVTHRPQVAEDWGLCLITEGGDKDKCLGKISKHVVGQETLVATTILLSVSSPPPGSFPKIAANCSPAQRRVALHIPWEVVNGARLGAASEEDVRKTNAGAHARYCSIRDTGRHHILPGAVKGI